VKTTDSLLLFIIMVQDCFLTSADSQKYGVYVSYAKIYREPAST